MERSGPEGVFAQMAEEGHINLLADMAEEAIDLVASKLRRDPSFREVLGMMEDEDGDVFVRYAATHLLRENLTEEE
jgi:2-hydroxy-3-keto-5-methylthiopentenyl-1-phosphate phosphatase